MKGAARIWLFLALFIGTVSSSKSAERWEISGVIDGTDEIIIRQSDARWEHSFGNLEASYLEINGVHWNPALALNIENAGNTRYASNRVNFLAARMQIIEGRDTVVLRKERDQLRLSIADTPNGPGTYRIAIDFPTSPALLVEADIDGSDELQITFAGALWVHKHWSMPSGVRLNGIDWDPAAMPILTNGWNTVFLDAPVAFENAVVLEQTGRGLAVVRSAEDGIVISFADSEVGPGRHTLLIVFPPPDHVANGTIPVIARADLRLDQAAEIVVQTIRGAWYELQYADELSASQWTSSGAFLRGNGENMALYDPVAGRNARFYRVLTKPEIDTAN